MSPTPENRNSKVMGRLLEQSVWYICGYKSASIQIQRNTETAIEINLKHLRQAILKKAFSGKLVSQEHNKETADKLN